MTPAASEVRYSGPYRYQPRHTAVVCTNTRGSGFSELCWHAQIPLEPDERVSDLITAHVGSDDGETVFASTSNPAGLYSMRSGDSWVTYYPLYYQMNADRYDSCVKMAPLCGEMEGKIVCHEEQTNRLLLVDTASSTLWRMETEGVMSSVLTSARGIISRSMAQDNQNKRWKMNTGLCDKNVLVLYEVDGCRVCVLNMNDGRAHHLTLPHSIANINPLSEQDWLVEAHQQDDITPSRFLYSVSTSTEEVVLRPITEDISAPGAARLPRVTSSACESLSSGADLITAAGGSLPQASFDFRLLSASGYQAAVLAMPSRLAEGKDNGTSQGPDHWRVIGWRRPGGTGKVAKGRSADLHRHRGSSPPLLMSHTGQVVNVLNMDEIPMEFRHQVALGHPSLTSYLELVNLPSQTVKYLPVTSGMGGGSIPPRDWRVMVARHENGGVYTIDTAGRLSQWETESVTLEQSLDEWRRAVGAEADLQITYDRDTVDDVSSPKHGKHDPTNAPHVGGNMWAGGTGGRDTAGLGGLGGPYRLDAGHHVHQVPEQAKATIPEHIKQAAREMNRKTFEERLRQIQMSEHDAKLYQQICGNVKSQIQSLRVILTGLQAKDKERLWMKNQTSGELDDAKIIEGLTGERSVYKRRGNLDPEMGAPQEKPKLLRLVTDVSGSMYRFNGYDGRLDRMIEVVAMVMEAFAGFEDKFRYDVIGHSGEDYRIAFVKSSRPPTNEKERLQVLKTMRAHSQFCMSGDSTLEATAHAVDTADTDGSDETFVIVLSDANLERYGIPAERLGQVMVRDDQVNVSAVFLGSLGDQADRMRSKLPAGSSFVCLDVDRLPRILQSIFTSGILN